MARLKANSESVLIYFKRKKTQAGEGRKINRSAPWSPENLFAIFFRRKKYRNNNNQDLSIARERKRFQTFTQ